MCKIVRASPLKGVFELEHRVLMDEYDTEGLGTTYAVALSCWKVPSTGLTTSALSSKLCNAPLQKALNLEDQNNISMSRNRISIIGIIYT